MLWTVVFGDSPLDHSGDGKANVTQVRAFPGRKAAEAFATLCRARGLYADVQEHIVSNRSLNGATKLLPDA